MTLDVTVNDMDVASVEVPFGARLFDFSLDVAFNFEEGTSGMTNTELAYSGAMFGYTFGF